MSNSNVIQSTTPKLNRLVSPTSVHHFADDSSDATETTSNCNRFRRLGLEMEEVSRTGENSASASNSKDEVFDLVKYDTANHLTNSTCNGIREDDHLNSKFCDYSSDCCGLTAEVQDLLLHSAKWFCLRMPTIMGRQQMSDGEAAVLIQSKWRSYMSKQHYDQTLQSVIVYFELGEEEEEEDVCTVLKNESAIIIQKNWRKCAAIKHLRALNKSILMIQKFARLRLAQRQLKRETGLQL